MAGFGALRAAGFDFDLGAVDAATVIVATFADGLLALAGADYGR